MQKYNLAALARKLTGRKVRRLRKEGVLPATLYGKKIKSSNVQVSQKEFLSVYSEVGETGLLDLALGKNKHPVLVSNVQVHPVTGLALHIDFREVDLTEKITASVPVELVGESPAEKQGIGTLVLLVDELEVEALPADLPEKFEIDATALVDVDQTFTVGELKYDKKKVTIDAEKDQVLAKVEPPQKEEIVETPASAEATAGEPAEGAPVESGEAKLAEGVAEATAGKEEKKKEK